MPKQDDFRIHLGARAFDPSVRSPRRDHDDSRCERDFHHGLLD